MRIWRSGSGSLACAVIIAAASCGLAQASTAAPARPAMAADSARQSLASARAMVDGDSIASFFLNLAKDPVKNFVMDKLGIATTESQLHDLANKLDALQLQLTALEQRVTGLITQLGLTEAVREANHATDGLDTFYRDYFAVIGTDLYKLKQAQDRVPPDPAAVKKEMDQYESDVRTFISTANSRGLNERITTIKHVFEPGSGATGLMRAVGESLLQKHQYLTPADSDEERSIYVYYEENQALAAWMTCEWQIARGHPELVPSVVREFEQAVAVQRNPDTRNGLPPLLPRWVMLDRGTNPATILDSRNKMMYFGTHVLDAIWLSGRPEFTSDDPVQVPKTVADFNAAGIEGFRNWTVPSQAEVNALFNELGPRRDSETIQIYLQKLNLAANGTGPFIWTRDVAHRWAAIGPGPYPLHYEFDSYEGISTRNLSPDEHPRLCDQGDIRNPCRFFTKQEIIERYNAARGMLILIRNSGDIRYF
jgi:hypothetical protein